MTFTAQRDAARERDVTLFYLYRIVSRLYFHLPILFLHFYSVDMGLFLTEVLLAVYGLTIMLTSEVSGVLLRYMRQKSVVAFGEILKAVGLLLIILGTRVAATNFWIPLVGQVVGGCGFSIAISTDSSLLRSITSSTGADVFGKIQSKSQSYMFLSTLIAGSIGSILFDYEAHWPFYASILVSIVAAVAILLIREKKSPMGSQVSRQKVELVLKPEQKFWINFYALSRAFTLAPFVGFLPFFFIMLQVDPYLFGVVLSLFSIAAFFSALYSTRLLAKLGVKILMIGIISSMLTSMLLFGFFDYFSDYFLIGLLAIFLLGIGSGGVRPLTMSNLNLSVMSAQQRTKLLSLMERQFGIWNTLLLISGACLLIEQGFQPLMVGLAGSYLVLFFVMSASRFLQ